MKVIIVGCGQVGANLAYQICKMGHKVIVIDQDANAFDHLAEEFDGRVITGDALLRTVLHRAEVESADGLFTLTNSDPLNALIAYIARTEFSVPIVAARNNDPRLMPLQESFGIYVIGTPDWKADSVVDLLSGDVVQAIRLDHKADLIIYKITVPAKWTGQCLDEWIQSDQVELINWIRKGSEILSEEPHSLEEGDQIYLKADAGVIESLRNQLDSKEERTP